jgi:hypothetical protein
MAELKAPFIWFGGKRKVACDVWKALGDVDNYVEPFAGSLAVLLGRPIPPGSRQRLTETVNDADHYLSNFWRALAADPDEVARWSDWPVNEDDLFARHIWLVTEGRERLAKGIAADPFFFDPMIAGWWVWGINSWIGGGWCSGSGPWHLEGGEVVCGSSADGGVSRQLPHLGSGGQGVTRKRPHLGNSGQGITRGLPHLGDAGQGINRKRPHLGDAGRTGFWRMEHRSEGIAAYFLELADRLRDVRVCTGDWSRIVTKGALTYGGTVGVFLDPPYSTEVRTAGIYSHDGPDVALECKEWCLEHGDDKRLRIVLAGYRAEHDDDMPDTWRRVYWTAGSAYQTSGTAGGSDGNQSNRQNEVLWLSPGCVGDAPQLGMWS